MEENLFRLADAEVWGNGGDPERAAPAEAGAAPGILSSRPTGPPLGLCDLIVMSQCPASSQPGAVHAVRSQRPSSTPVLARVA